jgi:hypothetical protein
MAACCWSQVGRRGRSDISAFIVALRESLLWRITTLADQRKPLTQSAAVVVRPGNSATEISAEGCHRRDDDRDDDRRRGLLLLLRWCGSSTLLQERLDRRRRLRCELQHRSCSVADLGHAVAPALLEGGPSHRVFSCDRCVNRAWY